MKEKNVLTHHYTESKATLNDLRNQLSVNNINEFPFYITYTLLFIKLLYYKSNIISSATFKYFKNILMETYLNQDLHDNLIAIKI